MWGFLNILKTLLFINAWIESSTYIVDVYKSKLFSISCSQIKKLTFVGQICPPPKKAQLPNNISCCIVYNLHITDMHVMNTYVHFGFAIMLSNALFFYLLLTYSFVWKICCPKKFIHGFCTLFIPSRNNYLYLNCRNHKSTPFEYFSYITQFLLGQ